MQKAQWDFQIESQKNELSLLELQLKYGQAAQQNGQETQQNGQVA
jgi:hypothetical protein